MSGRSPMPVGDRFWEKVDRTAGAEGCWEWRAHLAVTGYGRFRFGGRMVFAHRFSYEWMVGPIPQGLVIDHLCSNRRCVNPAHLEVVTLSENTRRGNLWKGVCRTGRHKIDGPDDIYDIPSGRRCKACSKAAAKKDHEKRRDKRLAQMKALRQREASSV